MASVISAGNATNGLGISSDNTGILQVKTGSGAGTTALTIDASQNATLAGAFTTVGGYPAYQCRAWVNFNGTGTVAIRASGNVSSITDNGVGNYTVNFVNAMVDANHSAVANMKVADSTATAANLVVPYLISYLTTSVRLLAIDAATFRDTALNSVAIFR